jgi:DNA-binding CsgD family transcriptional regulator
MIMSYYYENTDNKQENFLIVDSKGRLALGQEFGNEYLTKREVEIIKYILQGYSAKSIALQLDISYRTVESYINILKLKCRCNRKNDLIIFCIKLGIFKILI